MTATAGGLPAVVQYKGAVAGVTPGGYVSVVLRVGNASTVNGAIWIAVVN